MAIDHLSLRQKDVTYLLAKEPLQIQFSNPSTYHANNAKAIGLYNILYLHELVEHLKVLNRTNKKILAHLEKGDD